MNELLKGIDFLYETTDSIAELLTAKGDDGVCGESSICPICNKKNILIWSEYGHKGNDVTCNHFIGRLAYHDSSEIAFIFQVQGDNEK